VQSDRVLEPQVATGRGERLTCSPDRNPGLFDAVRAGLGQVGVITRATLRLVPAPRQVRRFLLSYADLATMLGDQRLLTREHRFEGVQGAVLAAPSGGWTFRLDLAKEFNGPPRPTRRCSPTCPMTGRGRSRACCPSSTTSTGSARRSGCFEPAASGGSRIPG
jgi:cytokinin dehydrogenase